VVGSTQISIGANAGASNQGSNAVAIGANAGATNQPANSIVINASGSALNGATSSALYVNPIRTLTGATGVLSWNSTSFEITADGAKTFVIPHPIDPSRHLVHACLEGPESAVFYRGRASISETGEVIVHLPDYVKAIATDMTIQITPIHPATHASVSEVVDNSFTIFGSPHTSCFWIVHGKRHDIEVEPLTSDVHVQGFGPYTWIE